jgi:folate-binding protein YgfZ
MKQSKQQEILAQKSIYFELKTQSILQISGKDCHSFLNRITTIKPQRLQANQATLCFVLDSKANVEVAFDLLKKKDGQAYYLQCATSALEKIKKIFDFYLFAEDFKLEVLNKSYVCLYGNQAKSLMIEMGYQADLPDQQAGENCLEHDKFIIYQNQKLGVDGFEIWSSAHQHANLIHKLSNLASLDQANHFQTVVGSEIEYEILRRLQGKASYPQEYVGIPLEISKDGIHEQKGCYPGQEVIERMIALGKPAKQILRFRLEKANLEKANSQENPHKTSAHLSDLETTNQSLESVYQYDAENQTYVVVGEILSECQDDHDRLISTRLKPKFPNQPYYDSARRELKALPPFSSFSVTVSN